MSRKNPSQEALARQVAQLFTQGATLGALRGYTEQEYEAVYAVGHAAYTSARYLDALKSFGFLVMNNPYERRFVMAYASSLHMLRRHEDAVVYYSLASAMDMGDPVPTFHTAECLIALRMQAEARQALGFVVKQCAQPHRAALKGRAEALLRLLGPEAVH